MFKEFVKSAGGDSWVAVFLEYKKGCLYSPINTAIAALRFYCLENHFPNVTGWSEFNTYRKSCRRIIDDIPVESGN